MGFFGRMVCHPENKTILYSWLIFSHQGSCTRNMSNTGFSLCAIMYIAACIAVFDRFMFKLHTEIKVVDLACSIIEDVVGWVQFWSGTCRLQVFCSFCSSHVTG